MFDAFAVEGCLRTCVRFSCIAYRPVEVAVWWHMSCESYVFTRAPIYSMYVSLAVCSMWYLFYICNDPNRDCRLLRENVTAFYENCIISICILSYLITRKHNLEAGNI